uniref:Uncharacterized protein n=1 Tax=Chenopodium quinoa TaxID=63459 RepID=A0A803LIX2_CHEQI
MKTSYSILFYYFVLFILSHNGTSEANSALSNDNVYIVYMGANKNSYDTLLSSLISRNKSSIIHTYKHGFSRFAAQLSESEALQLSKQPGVVSVFPDPLLQLHTTRSWDFLHYGTLPWTASQSDSTAVVSPTKGSDTIIGILDTGIWPESESFSDKGMGPIPRRWRGKCMEGKNFNSSNCNKKLIGARHYSKSIMDSPRDDFGHGTHVASTAAGAPVANASYYGLANGTARGGSPTSRIAMYRVFSNEEGCLGSAILAAFDNAIADVQKGITVVCSAGNGGPSPQSVVNVAPWIITVAATTIDRDFESDIVLGNNIRIKGGSINFSKLIKSPVYPLISGGSAKNKSASEYEARNCYPDSIDAEKIRGKIVLCQQADNSDYVATILPTKTVQRFKPAPTVAFFSSRGPSSTTLNILKPDIAAPGVNILAAWKANDTLDETTPEGREPSLFNVISGTSMACPHVIGIAANIKSQNPAWTPAAIRYAIMTTGPITVNRTVTTVDTDDDPVYTVTVKTPTELEVDVSPTELRFTAATKKLEYMVTFSTSDSSVKGDLFGAITWRSNKFIVRSPFVVSRSGRR